MNFNIINTTYVGTLGKEREINFHF